MKFFNYPDIKVRRLLVKNAKQFKITNIKEIIKKASLNIWPASDLICARMQAEVIAYLTERPPTKKVKTPKMTKTLYKRMVLDNFSCKKDLVAEGMSESQWADSCYEFAFNIIGNGDMQKGTGYSYGDVTIPPNKIIDYMRNKMGVQDYVGKLVDDIYSGIT